MKKSKKIFFIASSIFFIIIIAISIDISRRTSFPGSNNYWEEKLESDDTTSVSKNDSVLDEQTKEQ